MRVVFFVLIIANINLFAFEELWNINIDGSDVLLSNNGENVIVIEEGSESDFISIFDANNGDKQFSIPLLPDFKRMEETEFGLLIFSGQNIFILDLNNQNFYDLKTTLLNYSEANYSIDNFNDYDVYGDKLVLSTGGINDAEEMTYNLLMIDMNELISGEFNMVKNLPIEYAMMNIAMFKNQGIYDDVSYLNCDFSSTVYCVHDFSDGDFILEHKQAKHDILQNDSLLIPITGLYDFENRQRFLPNYYCVRIEYFDEFRGYNCGAKSNQIDRDHYFKLSDNLQYGVFVDRAKENVFFLELDYNYYEEESIVEPFLEIEPAFDEVNFYTAEGLIDMSINNAGDVVFMKEVDGMKSLSFMKKDEFEDVSISRDGIDFQQIGDDLIISSEKTSQFEVQIIDLLGNTISYVKSNSNNLNINTSDYDTGAYFIKVLSNQNAITFKIIVE